jgi:excinuclease ABC subunit A
MTTDTITIRGARQHNLKGIDLDLPKGKLVVVTGLSGSGKSTLAFDTLYAEGQRRYVESLSTYARQFLERLEKPDVDLIEGLSPAIAIEQRAGGHNPRSTVGTVTEIYDFLRLLYARVGIPHCPRCGGIIDRQTLDEMVDRIMALPEGTRFILYAPIVSGLKGSHAELIRRLKKDGFARIRVDGRILELESVKALDKRVPHSIEVVVDRLVAGQGISNRLADSLQLALAESDGRVVADVLASGTGNAETFVFSEKAACARCGVSLPEVTPAGFSFNSPQGACPRCGGLGTAEVFDPALIVPNPALTLREGAVAPWAERSTVRHTEFMEALSGHYGQDIYTPYEAFPESFREILMNGAGEEKINLPGSGGKWTFQPFEGVIPNLQHRHETSGSRAVREAVSRYRSLKPCPACGGARLCESSLGVTVGDRNIASLCALSVAAAKRFFEELSLSSQQAAISRRIVKEICHRLGFLESVGLPYLTLDRSANTLSGGESQRIRLATQVGSKLSGVLYVLDEPSIGLHPRDNRRLLTTLLAMRDLGNTVLVVEHDEETIRSADWVVDMGPGAGVKGGEVVFSGPPEKIVAADGSLTGAYLSGRRLIPLPRTRRSGNGNRLVVRGASENNLKNLEVAFPLGCFVCVTGVSGSGKSTLVLETLYRALSQRLYLSRTPAGQHGAILGLEHIDKVVHIDQSPIGKTPRSNPGTYTGLFTHIRDLFARTPDARARGFKSGRFSFNVKGGRCEACGGDGIIRIEMHFLPDVFVTCEVCGGKRYNRETLEIRYKGRNINDVLHMTVNQGLAFFENIGVIRDKLQTLADVGLGYVQVGQAATTLSGGEAQRVKLSRELSKRGGERTLYILDEPTTGLHMEDVRRLLEVLERLVEGGATVVVIEHNLDVIKSADYIIDMGPEGGDGGGEVIGCGTPEQIAGISGSHTGMFLKSVL